MVSFDIVSLFTNTLREKSLDKGKNGIAESTYEITKIICDQYKFSKEKPFINEVLNFNNYPNSFLKKSFTEIGFPQAKQSKY